MKITVSIPDALFQRAEDAAEERGISRSQLYAEALQSCLSETEEDELTAAMNEALGDDVAEWREAAARSAAKQWS